MLRGKPTRSDVSITPAPTNSSKTRTEVNVNENFNYFFQPPYEYFCSDALPASLSLRTQKKNLEVVDESKGVFSVRETPSSKHHYIFLGGEGGGGGGCT